MCIIYSGHRGVPWKVKEGVEMEKKGHRVSQSKQNRFVGNESHKQSSCCEKLKYRIDRIKKV